MTTEELLRGAKAAKAAAAALSTEEKNRLLCVMADSLVRHEAQILSANERDVEAAKGHIAPAMIDRLRLTGERVAAMAEGLRAVASLPDPVGEILSQTTRPNGLCILLR